MVKKLLYDMYVAIFSVWRAARATRRTSLNITLRKKTEINSLDLYLRGKL